jgi:hypothetical protein
VKIQVDLDIAGRKFREVVTGQNAGELLVHAKARVAKELGWKGLAQETVRQYNDAFGTKYALPNSAEEFMTFGESTGYVTVLSEDED